MLPKKKRVTKNTFQTIMDKGGITSGSFFVFRYLKQEKPAFAVVAPKKIAKKATERNALRRKGYNILRLYNPLTGAGIFFYKKEALVTTIPDLKGDIEFLLKKTKFI